MCTHVHVSMWGHTAPAKAHRHRPGQSRSHTHTHLHRPITQLRFLVLHSLLTWPWFEFSKANHTEYPGNVTGLSSPKLLCLSWFYFVTTSTKDMSHIAWVTAPPCFLIQKALQHLIQSQLLLKSSTESTTSMSQASTCNHICNPNI